MFLGDLLCPWNSPGHNTGVGCHSLLQGIFLTQRSNQDGLLHGRQILYHLSHQGSPFRRYRVSITTWMSWKQKERKMVNRTLMPYVAVKKLIVHNRQTRLKTRRTALSKEQHLIPTWAYWYFVEQIPAAAKCMFFESTCSTLTKIDHMLALKVKWKELSCVRLFATPWTIQSLEFSRPEYWSG